MVKNPYKYDYPANDFCELGETQAQLLLRWIAEREGLAIARLRELVPARAAKSKARVKRHAATKNHAKRLKVTFRENSLASALESLAAQQALSLLASEIAQELGQELAPASSPYLENRPAQSLFEIVNRPSYYDSLFLYLNSFDV